MKRFLLVGLLISCCCSLLKAQIRCGTHITPEMETMMQEQAKLLSKAKISGSSTITYVPMRINVIRQSDGSTTITEKDIVEGIARLNKCFSGTTLQFYMAGDFNYIDNSAYYDFSSSQESSLCPLYDLPNAVNVYIPHTVFSGGPEADGYGYVPGSYDASKRVVISYAGVKDAKTWAHTMGHFYNLLDTFYNSDNINTTERELVTRDKTLCNCTIKGDLLCDTPADPYNNPSGYVDKLQCKLINGGTDANGDTYDPDIHNMMSLWPSYYCGFGFTGQQIARMSASSGLPSRSSLTYGPSPNYPGGLTGYPYSNGVHLEWTDNSTDETGFIIERSLSPGNEFEVIGYAPRNATTYNDINGDLLSYTTYYYRIRQANSTRYSNTVSVTSNIVNCIPKIIDTLNNLFINSFALNGNSSISNLNSGSSPNRYGNFKGFNANVTAGMGIGFSYGTPGPDYYPQIVEIFADLDHNGDFDGPEEKLYQNTVSLPTFSDFITIPLTALNGKTTLRVRCNSTTEYPVFNACETLMYGETEDYTITISGATPAPVPLISLTFPADKDIGINTATDIRIKFNRDIIPGKGNIIIVNKNDNSIAEKIPAYSPMVTFPGDSTVTINPSVNLLPQTTYCFLLDSAFAFHLNYGNNPIKDSLAWTFTTSIYTGTKAPLGRNTFRVYPNPTAGEINVSYSPLPGDTRIKVLSLEGVELEEVAVTSAEIEVSLRNYPKGMYFLEFLYEGLPIQFEKILYR